MLSWIVGIIPVLPLAADVGLCTQYCQCQQGSFLTCSHFSCSRVILGKLACNDGKLVLRSRVGTIDNRWCYFLLFFYRILICLYFFTIDFQPCSESTSGSEIFSLSRLVSRQRSREGYADFSATV